MLYVQAAYTCGEPLFIPQAAPNGAHSMAEAAVAPQDLSSAWCSVAEIYLTDCWCVPVLVWSKMVLCVVRVALHSLVRISVQ